MLIYEGHLEYKDIKEHIDNILISRPNKHASDEIVYWLGSVLNEEYSSFSYKRTYVYIRLGKSYKPLRHKFNLKVGDKIVCPCLRIICTGDENEIGKFIYLSENNTPYSCDINEFEEKRLYYRKIKHIVKPKYGNNRPYIDRNEANENENAENYENENEKDNNFTGLSSITEISYVTKTIYDLQTDIKKLDMRLNSEMKINDKSEELKSIKRETTIIKNDFKEFKEEIERKMKEEELSNNKYMKLIKELTEGYNKSQEENEKLSLNNKKINDINEDYLNHIRRIRKERDEYKNYYNSKNKFF